MKNVILLISGLFLWHLSAISRETVAQSEARTEENGLFEQLLTRGRFLSTEGELEKAIEVFKQAAELRPDSEIPPANIGILYARSQQFEEGAIWFERAVARAPGNPRLLTDAARCLYYAGYYPRARELYRRAVDVAPKDFSARMLLGNLLARLGDHEAALREYTAIPEEDPLYIEATQKSVASYIEMARPEEALELAEFLVGKYPDRHEGYAVRGMAKKACAEAHQLLPGPGLEDLLKSLEMGNREAKTIVKAAEVAYQAGDYEKAAECLALWQGDPTSEYLLWRGKTRLQLEGHEEEGLADLKRAVELDALNIDAIYGIAWHYFRTGDTEKRDKWMNRYHRVWSSKVILETQFSVGSVGKATELYNVYLAGARQLREAGQTKQALDMYATASEMGSQDVSVLEEYLGFLLDLGQWRQAGETAREFADQNPERAGKLVRILSLAAEEALLKAGEAEQEGDQETGARLRALAESWYSR